MDSASLDSAFRKGLVKALKGNGGKIPVIVSLSDRQTGYKIDFRSKKYAVAISGDLFVDLQKAGVGYSVQVKA